MGEMPARLGMKFGVQYIRIITNYRVHNIIVTVPTRAC